MTDGRLTDDQMIDSVAAWLYDGTCFDRWEEASEEERQAWRDHVEMLLYHLPGKNTPPPQVAQALRAMGDLGSYLLDAAHKIDARVAVYTDAIEKASYYLNPNQGETPDPSAASMWLCTAYPADHPNYLSPGRVREILARPERKLGSVPNPASGTEMAEVTERWQVVDKWWTDEPVHGSYIALKLADGTRLSAKIMEEVKPDSVRDDLT